MMVDPLSFVEHSQTSPIPVILLISALLLVFGLAVLWTIHDRRKPRLPRTVEELRAEVLERHEEIGDDVCRQITERRKAERRRMALERAREKGHNYNPLGDDK